MSTSLSTLIRLRTIQNKTRRLFDNMSDIEYRLQYHSELSPAGWYLGHGIYTENYWLHEIISNNNEHTCKQRLFAPLDTPKAQRGPSLPPLNPQLQKIHAQQDNNDLLLLEKTPPLSNHPLFKDEYIENYLIQQYAQNYEAIHMVLNQIALKKDHGQYCPEHILIPTAYTHAAHFIEQSTYTVGGEKPLSYDNELPMHQIKLDAFYIAVSPVNNSEYLQFIEDGGYTDTNLWSSQGWQWKTENNISHPEHWKKSSQGHWYGVNHQGAFDLPGSDFVYGISHHEACAFAKWAQARLPHEHEWETAARLNQLKNTTKVWEWCNNNYTPYKDFSAFPASDCSEFSPKNNHYVLKGASEHTRPEIKRASFRNTHMPHQRHAFTGLRLVFD